MYLRIVDVRRTNPPSLPMTLHRRQTASKGKCQSFDKTEGVDLGNNIVGVGL